MKCNNAHARGIHLPLEGPGHQSLLVLVVVVVLCAGACEMGWSHALGIVAVIGERQVW